jgi:predicted DNA-binding mobile mystery protein A
MEASEADDSIRLGTLRRAAEALDGRLVYAIVPTAPLESVVDKRAREVAEREVESIRQTMRLENQLEGASDEHDLVDELAQDLKASRRLWRD